MKSTWGRRGSTKTRQVYFTVFCRALLNSVNGGPPQGARGWWYLQFGTRLAAGNDSNGKILGLVETHTWITSMPPQRARPGLSTFAGLSYGQSEAGQSAVSQIAAMRAVVTILGVIAVLAFADFVKETHQKANS